MGGANFYISLIFAIIGLTNLRFLVQISSINKGKGCVHFQSNKTKLIALNTIVHVRFSLTIDIDMI